MIIFNSDSSFRSSAVKVSKEELSMFQTMFSMFDKDGDGTIDTKELGTLLRSLGKERSHLIPLLGDGGVKLTLYGRYRSVFM